MDAIDIILENEKGFVNHPNDKGGPTNFGITLETYSKYKGHQITVEELQKLTRQQAREIYEREYLYGTRVDGLKEPLRTLVLDMVVNHSPKNAIRMLQRVLNNLGYGPLRADGVLGPVSRETANKALDSLGLFLLNFLCNERELFYYKIVIRDNSQRSFIAGWLNRNASFWQDIKDSQVVSKPK